MMAGIAPKYAEAMSARAVDTRAPGVSIVKPSAAGRTEPSLRAGTS